MMKPSSENKKGFKIQKSLQKGQTLIVFSVKAGEVYGL